MIFVSHVVLPAIFIHLSSSTLGKGPTPVPQEMGFFPRILTLIAANGPNLSQRKNDGIENHAHRK